MTGARWVSQRNAIAFSPVEETKYHRRRRRCLCGQSGALADDVFVTIASSLGVGRVPSWSAGPSPPSQAVSLMRVWPVAWAWRPTPHQWATPRPPVHDVTMGRGFPPWSVTWPAPGRSFPKSRTRDLKVAWLRPSPDRVRRDTRYGIRPTSTDGSILLFFQIRNYQLSMLLSTLPV